MRNLDEKSSKRLTFIINTAYIALVGVLIFLGIRYLVPWLLPFVMGYTIAILVKPVARFLTKRCGLGPKLAGFVAVIFGYALIILLLILGGVRLVAVIRTQLAGLPYFFENTLEPTFRVVGDFFNETIGSIVPGFGFDSYEAFTFTLEDFRGALLTVSTTALNFLGTLGARLPVFILTFLFTIISSLIISMNYQQVASFLSLQIPEKHHELFFKIKNDAFKAVGSYFVAYFKIMCITFTQLAIGLSVLRVNNALLIALGVAVLDLFPVVGTGSVMIPWIIFEALRLNWPMVFALSILYSIITVVRGFIEPRIVGGQLGLHPLVAICAIYAGFQLMGFFGMILMPIVAQILVRLHRSGIITLWRSSET